MVIENLIIVIIALVVLFIFRIEISIFVIRWINKVFPSLNIEEPAVSSMDGQVDIWLFLVSAIVVAVMIIILRVVECMVSKKYRKEQARVREEIFENRRMFFEEVSIADKDAMEILLKQVKIVVLDEPVVENHYHHRNSTSDKNRWGVYVGRFFLKCDFTVATYRCVKLLRANGIYIKPDFACIYEKEEGIADKI